MINTAEIRRKVANTRNWTKNRATGQETPFMISNEACDHLEALCDEVDALKVIVQAVHDSPFTEDDRDVLIVLKRAAAHHLGEEEMGDMEGYISWDYDNNKLVY